jgi:hypothetical protein
MNKMSEEQRKVLDYIRAGHNVSVDACAGSGKSTTILSIAKELTGKSILQFTYNSMLRYEVKEKILELGLPNIQVHTYHSFAVKYYSSDAHTDTGIRKIIQHAESHKPRTPIPFTDIVVLDESQDLTFLYFQLVVKIIKDMCEPNVLETSYENREKSKKNHKIQLLVLGDYMQGLYEFKGADIRFLTRASEVWETLPYLQTPNFRKTTLKMSYRITNQMAKFVNRDMLGESRLEACRNGVPVVYIRRSRYQIEKIVVAQIRRLLEEGESPSDIFVLGGSVKGVNSNIRRMENVLTENEIPCHVPMFETDLVDERVIDGKVVFSTFHTVKGRQRKYVFVVGFDQNYFYTAKNIPKDVCPNTLYVACTRATHGLYLLENDQSRPLEFLKYKQHDMKQADYIDFKGMPQTIFHDRPDENTMGVVTIPTYYVTPTDLIKFISDTVLEEITPILERIFVTEYSPIPEDEIEIPKIFQTKSGFFEDVSDLNGIAIPAIYYDQLFENQTHGAEVLRNMVQDKIQEMKENSHLFLKRAVKSIPKNLETPSDYLYLANVFTAVQEKLYSKLKQIDRDEYTWLPSKIIEQCKSRLSENLGNMKNKNTPTEIEKELIHHSQEKEHISIDQVLFPYFGYETRFRFSARIDLLTEDTLWELKCVSKISLDNLMQLVIYAWLTKILYPEKTHQFKILNIRTGERLSLVADMSDLTYIVVALLDSKYGKKEMIEDDDFIQKCRNYITDET